MSPITNSSNNQLVSVSQSTGICSKLALHLFILILVLKRFGVSDDNEWRDNFILFVNTGSVNQEGMRGAWRGRYSSLLLVGLH